MFTTIPYQYRDAANFKEYSTIVVAGQLSEADRNLIKLTLEDADDFIPYDLGLGIEELQPRMTSYPSEDDVLYHELLLDAIETSDTVPEGTETIDAADFVDAFKRVRDSGGWKVVEASDRLEIY